MSSVKQATIEHKLVENAKAHLGGERVLKMFMGQTRVSPVMLPLISSLVFTVKPRSVMVTENSVITIQQSLWSQSTVVRLVSRHDCGSVPIEIGRWGLKIGDDAKIFASFSSLEDMREVARLASQPRS